MLCDRTREWTALRLDGELSDFETALMDSHLERCGGCRRFADELQAITHVLREAPLEQLSRPVELPRRRILPTRHFQIAAAAALVLLAAGLGSLYGAVHGAASSGEAGPLVHAPMVGYADTDMQLRQLRLAELKPTGPLPIGATKPVLRITV